MAISAVLDAARRSRTGRERRTGVWPTGHFWRLDEKRPEPIEMRERRHGYFPQVFVWRGRCYDVYAVERCWTISRPRGMLGGKAERYCFRVRAQPRGHRAGEKRTFELYQDLEHNAWYMRRPVA